jgi:hypothetical protein
MRIPREYIRKVTGASILILFPAKTGANSLGAPLLGLARDWDGPLREGDHRYGAFLAVGEIVAFELRSVFHYSSELAEGVHFGGKGRQAGNGYRYSTAVSYLPNVDHFAAHAFNRPASERAQARST